MDGVSAAASIWALVEATGTFLLYLKSVADANDDIKNLRKELTILYSLLSLLLNLETIAGDSSSSHRDGMIKAWRTLGGDDGPLAEYSHTLTKLSKKVVSGKNKVLKAIAWPFGKEDVVEMLGRIERLKSTINIVLNIDQMNLDMLALAQIEKLGERFDRSHDQTRLREALDWIPHLDSRSKKADVMSRTKEGTGSWFLNSTEFRNWLSSPQILFCPGMPGAGKTVMAALVAEYIETKIVQQEPSKSLAYIFCDFRAERQTVAKVLGSILQQIVQNSGHLSEPLLLLYENHIEKKTFPSEGDLMSCISGLISRQGETYLIVDAFDEFAVSVEQRRKLLDLLLHLQSTTKSLRLMIFSRRLPDIVERLQDESTLEVVAAPQDIKQYTASRLVNVRASTSDKLRDEIQELIVNSANGMFLLVRFLVDRFTSLHTPRQVKTLISQLSGELGNSNQTADVYGKLYRNTLTRIDSQPTSDRELAQQVLMWITTASRLLSPKELTCALSIVPGDKHFDEDNVYPLDLLLSVCCGLVIVDEASQTIRLVHHTAHEFFDSMYQDQMSAHHKKLGEVCLTYLCFEEFRTRSQDRLSDADPPSRSDTDSDLYPYRMKPGWQRYSGGFYHENNSNCAYEPTSESAHSSELCGVSIFRPASANGDQEMYALMNYAANYWGSHAEHCQVDIAESALLLLCRQELSAHAFTQANSLYEGLLGTRSHDFTSVRITGLHLICAIGLDHICRRLLDIIDKTKCDEKTTAEEREVEKWMNDNDIHRYNINKGIHADARDDERRTALMWAAHHGHEHIVRLLLERADVDPAKKCHREETALHYAARPGHLSIVELLIQDGSKYSAEIGQENCFGQSALVQAVLGGHREVAKALESRDTLSINQEVMLGLWPVHLAAQLYTVEVMKILIDDFKVSLDVQDPKGHNPLTVAVDWGNEEVVRYFFQEQKVWVGENKDQVIKAAHLAAAHVKRLTILELIILDASYTLISPNAEGRSLLGTAVDNGNMAAVMLISRLAGQTQ